MRTTRTNCTMSFCHLSNWDGQFESNQCSTIQSYVNNMFEKKMHKAKTLRWTLICQRGGHLPSHEQVGQSCRLYEHMKMLIEPVAYLLHNFVRETRLNWRWKWWWWRLLHMKMRFRAEFLNQKWVGLLSWYNHTKTYHELNSYCFSLSPFTYVFELTPRQFNDFLQIKLSPHGYMNMKKSIWI